VLAMKRVMIHLRSPQLLYTLVGAVSSLKIHVGSPVVGANNVSTGGPEWR
jgi:hypothetical protein